MHLFEKLYTFIIFLAVIIGIVLGQVGIVSENAESFIVPLLMAMLYITFLQIPLEEVRESFKNIKFTFTSLLINFAWTPILAWLLAMFFLGDSPALYIGFIMLMVTPCTDWYLIFTGIAKGNAALSTALLPLNLLVQLLLLPMYLLVFRGTRGIIEFGFLMESVLLVLIIPFVMAVISKMVLRKKKRLREKLISKLTSLPILFLGLAILAMFASQGRLLMANIELLWQITVPILLFFIVNFFVGQSIGKLMGFRSADRISLSLTTLARNSPVALAVAMTAFPDQPLIALTLVMGPLLELPLLVVVSQVLLFLFRKKSTHPS
jgi:arsenite transporter